MGFSLKKLGRGIKKIAKKNKGGLTRLVKKVGPGLVLGAVTGGVGAGIIAKAASAAKTLGKKSKGLETPKSLVPVVRAAQIAVKKRTRSKMPGGAPIPTISTPSVGMMSSKPQAKRRLYDRPARQARKGKKFTSYQTPDDMRGGMTKAQNTGRTGFEGAKRKRTGSRKAPSAKQLAARAKFAAMVKARRKKKVA